MIRDDQETVDEPQDQGLKTPLDLQAIDFLIGQVLESRYRIDEEVGRGGMGVVYRGTDLTLSRPVAIKTILHNQSDEEGLNRFIREAKTLAQIEHTKLVPVYAVGQDEGYHYLVMKFLEGETLSARLKREGQQSAEFTRNVVQQVCEALHALHSQNLIHRDIKPANLMISPTGSLTVMDLGIVKQIGEENNTTSSVAIGTPRYMPPEAVDSRPLDPRADLYSLGVIAYQMLVGEPPFNGPTPMSILYQQAHIQAPRVREGAPNVPKNLESAIEIALQKQPESRFQSAIDMARAFDASAHFVEPGQGRFKWFLIAFLSGVLGFLLLNQDLFMKWRPMPRTDQSQTSPPRSDQIKAQTNPAETGSGPEEVNETQRINRKQQPSLPKQQVKGSSTQSSERAKSKKREESDLVKVRLSSQPRNAKIYQGAKLIGTTPHVLTKPKGETKVFTLKLQGFKDHPLVVKDRNVKAQMKSIFGGF